MHHIANAMIHHLETVPPMKVSSDHRNIYPRCSRINYEYRSLRNSMTEGLAVVYRVYWTKSRVGI